MKNPNSDALLEDVIKHYGDTKALAKKLGVTVHAVYQWRSSGVVPELRAMQIQKITRGKFKASQFGYDLPDSKGKGN